MQHIAVDSSMADANGDISAVGYIDVQTNADDENADVCQGETSPNIVAWS